MKKEYPTYYDYFIALYKVRIFWYSIFGTMALFLTKALIGFNIVVYLIIQIPLLTFLIWALIGFIRLPQLDFPSFCTFIGGELVYAKVEADYQNPFKDLPEGFVGKNYFIKKNPKLKMHYQASDFFIKHEDISWVYYQTVQHHIFGLRVKQTKELQIYAYEGSFTLPLRKNDDFDFADFIEERGVAFILGYSQQREAQYAAATSKAEFINTVVKEEQSILQADSAGPIYNKPPLEVAIFNYKSFTEQFQGLREQVMEQLRRGKRREVAIQQKATSTIEDTQQLTLDLDTASYQVLDEATREQKLHLTLDEQAASLDAVASQTTIKNHEIEQEQAVGVNSLSATEELERTVETVSQRQRRRKQKQTTNGGNI